MLLFVFDRSVFRTCFFALYFYLLLFNCQGSIFLAPFGGACLLYHSSFSLSIGFLKFFQKFFSTRFGCFSLPLLRQLHYSTTFFPFCQYLFLNFFHFVHSFNLTNFILPFLCISPFRLLNFQYLTRNHPYKGTFSHYYI